MTDSTGFDVLWLLARYRDALTVLRWAGVPWFPRSADEDKAAAVAAEAFNRIHADLEAAP